MLRPDTCVIVPTYNNASTLPGVLTGVASHTTHILVVNDGSTDGTAEVLAQTPGLQVVTYPRNRGKGWALRQGLARARALGYRYAISIDSDGQHASGDLPRFTEALETHPGALIVGARNMDQETVPGGSSFGHKFSNFWFTLETGLRCPDTQSGYRLYPLERLPYRYFTRKYEFEIEVLVRAAWRGIPLASVPVTVAYLPDRVTHFRPFWDFARISVLNSVLVLVAFLYVRPVQFLKFVFHG
jgi:glycosyltransferase involved in cell wall biosynthesis